MEFPHIKDNEFPYVNNVDVFKYQNNFDYARWQGKVSIKLLNVLWNSNYADVPGFANDSERDSWFDSQEGLIQTLESAFNITPENSIRIPVPYNDAYRFNYLVVDMPIQTSENTPIDFEFENTRVKRWYYFIDSMSQYAPNTTELYVTLDVWTTFSHTVEIPYLMLERGHAPMTMTTVSDFLANPIMNNEYLLAEDFNYGKETIVETSNYFPIGNGTKYVLFCAPYAQDDFASFGGSAYSGVSTPPSYANTDERWGYQITVNDYLWKYGDSDYSNANLPIHNQIQNGILNGCACYAIEGQYAQSFFNDCIENCVHFIHGIQAMFILDENMFTRGNGFSFRGKTIYPVSREINENDFNFTKAMFGFESKYADITKLYTSPYSELEITDDEGNIFSAKVENCGNIKMHEEVSLVYPFLNYNVFFSGINGDGTMNYTWKNVQNTQDSKNIWASDFSKFMMNWEIPVYSIFVSAESEYAANNFFGNQARRAGAIKDYQNAVRYANTNRENISDTFTTNTANVNRDTNAMVANTAADMATMVSNNQVACNTAERIVDNNNAKINHITSTNNAKINADANVTKIATIATTEAENAVANMTFANNTVANMIGAGINAISATGQGAATGGIQGAIGGGISGVASIAQQFNSMQCAGANMIASVSTNSDVANVSNAATTAFASNSTATNSEVASTTVAANEYQVDANNNSAITQTAATAATNNADAGRTKAAKDSNASATQTTETNNATYTRNANVVAEKANLVQKQLEVESTYKNARLQTPVSYSKYSGDFMPDIYQRRGVRMNIRTQTKAAIAQTGDAFLRYGYALHRIWDMSNGWHYGKHFTFWKAEDIWINEGSGLSGNAVNVIGEILLKGVTVWRNPNEIGKVSIYENI